MENIERWVIVMAQEYFGESIHSWSQSDWRVFYENIYKG